MERVAGTTFAVARGDLIAIIFIVKEVSWRGNLPSAREAGLALKGTKLTFLVPPYGPVGKTDVSLPSAKVDRAQAETIEHHLREEFSNAHELPDTGFRQNDTSPISETYPTKSAPAGFLRRQSDGAGTGILPGAPCRRVRPHRRRNRERPTDGHARPTISRHGHRPREPYGAACRRNTCDPRRRQIDATSNHRRHPLLSPRLSQADLSNRRYSISAMATAGALGLKRLIMWIKTSRDLGGYFSGARIAARPSAVPPFDQAWPIAASTCRNFRRVNTRAYMSELGQSRRFRDVCHRSAHPPTPDMLFGH